MPSDLTYIPLYISYGEIAQFVISDYISEQALLGNPYYNTEQPKHIYCATQALRSSFNNMDDEALLHSLAQYQYSLYSGFIGVIQNIFGVESQAPIPPTPPAKLYRFGIEDNIFNENRSVNMGASYMMNYIDSATRYTNSYGNGEIDIYSNDTEVTVGISNGRGGYSKYWDFGVSTISKDQGWENILKFPNGNSDNGLSAYAVTSINGIAADDTGNVSIKYTTGSVLFAGTNGVPTEDNAHLFWDDTNNALKITGNTYVYNGLMELSQGNGAGIAVHGIFIDKPVNTGHVQVMHIDQPNMRITLQNGNTDGQSYIQKPIQNFGELRIGSPMATYGASNINQAFLTLYTAGAQRVVINELGQIGIGTGTIATSGIANAAGLNPSAILQVDSTTQGFLQPRLTSAQRDAIVAPAEGLTIYNNTTHRNELYNGTSWVASGASLATSTIGISLDGGGSSLTTGQKGYVMIPYNAVITAWTIISKEVATMTFDVWKAAGTKPTVANTITAAAKPNLNNVDYVTSNVLTGWNVNINAGDVIGWNLDSVVANTSTWAVLELTVNKT